MSKEKTTQTKKLVKTRVRPDKSIEVELQKHPKDTVIGKILLFLIIAGIVVIPIVGLIIAIIQSVN